MKRLLIIIFLVSVVLFGFFIKVPEYIELNNLIIVEGIGLECSNDQYTVYLKEIIPNKDDSGIEYDYKYYTVNSDSIEDSYKLLDEKVNKKIFYKGTRYIITNCSKTDKLINTYNIKPKYIYHTNDDVKKELRKVS